MPASVAERGIIRVNPDLVVERLRGPRIFVIGMGTINPLGHDVATTWKNIKANKNGVSAVDIEFSGVKVAGVVHDFDPETQLGTLDRREIKRRSRAALFARKAAIEALNDAGMLNEEEKLKEGIDPTRVGVFIGTGIGGAMLAVDAADILRSGKRTTPSLLMQILLERVASTVSKDTGAKGPLLCPSAACSTGNVAISLGINEIRARKADAMIVGGTEAANVFTSLGLFKYSTALTNSADPETASKQFQKRADGFIFGEGVGILVIATEKFADKNGAHKYAELVGAGDTADAFHDTAPSGEGAVRAMQQALSYLTEEEQGEAEYLLDCHGTSTGEGDRTETAAIKVVFPRHILETRAVVYAPKHDITHTVGAAGGVEAIAGIKAMEEGIVPGYPTFTDPIEEASGLYIPRQTERRKTNVVVNNSFGFGGINSVSVFKAVRS